MTRSAWLPRSRACRSTCPTGPASTARSTRTENQDAADTEAWLFPQNEAFVARLEELAIPATVNVGPGTHTWPYWERGLHEAMPMLLEALGL